MGYIDDSLADNEVLIYRARFHWLHKAGAWLTLIAFVLAAVATIALVPGVEGVEGALAIAFGGLVLFVTMMMPMWTTEIGVTSQRFIFKRGWIWRTTDELQLHSIEEVNLHQGALGRIFDFGRLVLHGTGVNDIDLPTLADPVGLRKALQEAIGGATAAPPTSAAQVTPSPAAA